MLEWVLLISNLVLWGFVVHLYRTRAQDRETLRQLTEQQAGAEAEAFDFLDAEAVERMSTIRTLLDQIQEKAQSVVNDAPVEAGPSTPPTPLSDAPSESLSP